MELRLRAARRLFRSALTCCLLASPKPMSLHGGSVRPSMIYCKSNATLHRYSPHAQSAVKLLAEPQNSQPQRTRLIMPQ